LNNQTHFGGLAFVEVETPEPNLADVTALVGCLAGPSTLFPPTGCSVFAFQRADLTCDADVDLQDFAALSNLVRH
jgi:hypothetical protein